MNNDISNRWWFIDYLFDKYPWYRKRCGGHWEEWFVNGVQSVMWLQVAQCSVETNTRPTAYFGTPKCEDYR